MMSLDIQVDKVFVQLTKAKARIAELKSESQAYKDLAIDWVCGEPAPDCSLQVIGGYAVCGGCEYSKIIPRESMRRTDLQAQLKVAMESIKNLTSKIEQEKE